MVAAAGAYFSQSSASRSAFYISEQLLLLLLLLLLMLTDCVFYILASAPQVGAKLVVLNLSQQTDSSDLVGGFKPVEPRDALLPLLDTFQRLVRLTWSKGNNEDFLGRVTKYAQRQKWSSLLKAFQTAVQKASSRSQLPFHGKAALANFPHKLLRHLASFESTRVAIAHWHRSRNKLRRQTACCPAS